MRSLNVLLSGLLLSVAPLSACAEDPTAFSQPAEVKQFIAEMVKDYQFNADSLTDLFEKVHLHQSIIDAISRPAEAKPWYEYRQIFLTRDRVRGGVLFWNNNQAIIEHVAQTYKIAPEILVAIVGVETRYGQHTGRYPVIDSLSTLAFAYPPRAKFFRGELKQYLLMTREEGLDPLQQKGSYAGAMGMPQFISSSFRHYAVDFDKDGKRDLWDNTADALGSIANYFAKHGWRYNQPIANRVQVSGLKYRELIDNKSLKPRFTPEQMRLAGVVIDGKVPDDIKGCLIELDSGNGPEYWAAWENFYVISRYNHSALYAMAVHQLGDEIIKSR
ncbi:MAG: lytic murein transglycosylase B [Gammaproteobacteria bacterium]|nr:lytic murein transglycosylase B [Gammaproteobacteria bacterium]